MKPNPRILCVAFLTARLIAGPAFSDGTPPGPGQAKASAEDLYSMDLESLLNVKVTTASKSSERLSDAPGVMSVVTKDELRRFGGITLREILERVPGLAGSAAPFTDRSLIAARGDQTKNNGGHVLFLINGRPTREIMEGGLIGDLLESFPVDILERIEVIKGPGSVLYGSNAFSAVVNLITRKAEGDELVLTGLGGGAGAVATSARALFSSGHLSIVAAGQFHQKPDWSTRCFSLLSGFQDITIPDRGTGAYLGVNYKGLSFMSSYTEWKTSYIQFAVGQARWRRGFADLGYNWKASANWDMSFNLTYTRATLNADRSIPFIVRDSYELLLEWTNVVRLSDRDRLTFGTLYTHSSGTENSGLDAGRTTPLVQGSRPGEALYAQLDHELLDNLKLIGGVQAIKIGRIKLNLVPRAGVVWNPVTRFSVKALYSQAFRAPSLDESLLHYTPPSAETDSSASGIRTLAPERVATVDIGVSYLGDRFQAGVGYFHSKQTDNIVLSATPFADIYVNLGQVTFHGLEAEGKYYFRKALFLTGSALYQANRDGDGNRNVTPIANYAAKAGVGYDSPGALSVGLFDVYQGPVHGYAHALNPRPGAYNLLNAHLRFDLSKRLRLDPTRGLALVAHADNLANRAVWLPDVKGNPGDSVFSNRGRTVYVGIELSLKKE